MSETESQKLESTLDSNHQTNQPTNHQPPTYISARITLPHSQWEYLRDKTLYDIDYVVYPHHGKHNDNPHFHIFSPADHSRDVERYRRRVKAAFADRIGNGFFSIKFMSNGIIRGLQYGSREGTTPYVKGEELLQLMPTVPPWEDTKKPPGQTLLPYGLETRKERDWQLGYPNLVCQAVRHARLHGLGTSSLKEVVRHMLENTKWRPNKHMLSGGVPDFYQADFEFRTGKRSRQDMDWYTPKLREY